MNPLRVAAAALVLVSVSEVAATELIAEQIDRIAPLVATGEVQPLGGPEPASEIVAGLAGRWFTLNNTIRDWELEDRASRESLARSIDRLCADDWENIVTYSVTGPDRIHIDQRSPTGVDHGSFDLVAVDGGRMFSTVLEDDYILSIYGLEDAPQDQQQKALAEMKAALQGGQEIWLPGADVMVIRTAAEIEVWGRCPE
ncbi:hypothetical protein [Devosia sp. SD17-2]|uniref:hypothetical protein n=1 Tax=Devosia sp. SD17-2 TaxID=2976459 RepID=UPI0023D89B70|nr:hypothetical protein [Devosia sp. SD17-2]WEJ35032.1 hypothetical protein NYQ88_09615 [Devosia sp. SD17-2]